MSVTAVKNHIAAALTTTGTETPEVTDAEAALIVSKEDGWFSEPVSLGSVRDTQEVEAVRALRDKIVAGKVKASPKAEAMLNDVVIAGANHLESTLYFTFSGGFLGGMIGLFAGPGGAAAGAKGGAWLGAAAGLFYGTAND
jgi:hypothetical protein